MGLSEYATHTDRVDVVLATIESLRRERVAASPEWERTAVGIKLLKYAGAWRAYRERSQDCPPPWRPAKGRQAAPDAALNAALSRVRAQFQRIGSAKARLKYLETFVRPQPTAREASYAAREANYAAAREALPAWQDGDGRCPCRPNESCGRGCPNYLVGAQAAWCASKLPSPSRRGAARIASSDCHVLCALLCALAGIV